MEICDRIQITHSATAHARQIITIYSFPSVVDDQNWPQEFWDDSEFDGCFEKDEFSVMEKQLLMQILPPMPELPLPTMALHPRKGPVTTEYVIPEAMRQQLLQSLYPFTNCPKLSETRFDLHAQRSFVVRQYRIIREHERNFLVSPYYPGTGGMVVDWLPDSAPVATNS